jgi:chorismate mutase / prephenate dehydratase
MNEKKSLESVRTEIDLIDNKILDLINERAGMAIAAGKAKGDSIKYMPGREASIFNRLKDVNSGPITSEQIISIYKEIISSCRSTEADFKVAFLGPEGTYSESALSAQFGESVEKLSQQTIENVFKSVEDNQCDFGIVPIENSTEGPVNITLDCLSKSSVKICGEIEMKIHHNLLGHNKPLPREGFEIHAHEQTLAQCKKWLDSYCPDVERIAVASNAQGAINAASSDRVLAIAGDLAAKKYSLDILDSNIEDYSKNTTRFISIGKINSSPCGEDKTSLLITTKNEPGSLYQILKPINDLSLNLTHITYRPSRVDNWHYSFYLDIEGHQSEDRVKDLLISLEETEANIRVLGSYPRAVG